MQKGLFIVFEGPDGAGTTTHAKLLAERLRKEGKEVVLTAEPTEGKFGKEISEALTLKGAPGAAPTPKEIQQLFCSDRAEHVMMVIQPALDAGKIVISDRYVPSTLVYGEAQDLPLVWLKSLNTNFIQPDCTFLLLPPFAVGAKRLEKRVTRDLFEGEQV